MTLDQIDAIAGRHPDVFARPFFARVKSYFVAGAILFYFVFAWMFFSVGSVLTNGNWGIAGAYLADWISYEIRPDIEFEPGYLKLEFPRFSPLGAKPDPEWLQSKNSRVDIKGKAEEPGSERANAPASEGSFMAPGAAIGTPAQEVSPPDRNEQAAVADIRQVATEVKAKVGRADLTVVPNAATIRFRGESLSVDIVAGRVEPRGELPEWASQKRSGEKLIVRFGFAGRAEIEADEVKIRHRFLGWENFWFDTRSPFWGKPFSQVLALIFSADRIQPEQSNLSLAIDNFFNNAEWQHADVWIKLLQTIVMAFVGTLFATILAFPLAFAAARNITSSVPVNQTVKRLFDFLRSVDMLIWALFFTRALGPGPLAGMSAIFFTDTGTLGKLYSEALENIDDKQREGVRSLGASPVLVQRYGVVPQVLPIFLSQSLYFWESNTRSATIIGAVGAGGIGLKLWEAMRTNSDWENVAYMVILILIVVFVFDGISGRLRSLVIKGRT